MFIISSLSTSSSAFYLRTLEGASQTIYQPDWSKTYPADIPLDSIRSVTDPSVFTISPVYNSPVCESTNHCTSSLASVLRSNTLLLSIVEHATIKAATSASATSFEPVLNGSALFTFLFISITFSALILRTIQVEQAVQDRNVKLQRLRDIKTKVLDGDDSVTSQAVATVLDEYEQAVRTEERLRNVIAGIVRIVPPSSGQQQSEEDASVIAKQLLGQDFDIGMPKPERNESGKLSPVAIGALAVVGFLLLGQLAFLSWMYLKDPTSPMAASNTVLL